MKITISIVTYNNEVEIRGILNSLMSSDCINTCTVYVVDNGSTDGTIDIVRNEYPWVMLIESCNVGYGAGNNKVLLHVASDYHFVINPDILFSPNLLSGVISYLENDKNCVLCSPAIYNSDNVLVYSPKKDPCLRYIVARFLLKEVGILKRWNEEYTDYNNQSTQAYPIDICSGCFMAMRTEVAQQIGGFDERFFLYYEDFDLSMRMQTYGKIMCLPFLKVTHAEKREAYSSKTARKHMICSLIRYFNKWGWRI